MPLDDGLDADDDDDDDDEDCCICIYKCTLNRSLNMTINYALTYLAYVSYKHCK